MRRFASGVALAALVAAVVLVRPPQFTPAAAAAQPADLPADLALVPADAVGFVHVRAAEVWKSDLMAGFRQTFEKAGPKALAALDAQFVPAPSSFARATAFVLMDDKKRPIPVAVLTFSAAFDPKAVVKAYLPNNTTEKVGDKVVYRSPDNELEFHFPDDKHIVLGFGGSLDAYLSKPVAKAGPMADAIKLAASGKAIVGSANIAALPIPKDAFAGAPPELLPLLKAERITVSLDLGAEMKLTAAAGYADAAAARDAEKAVKTLAEMGRKELAKVKADLEKRVLEPKGKGPRPLQDLPEVIGETFLLGAINQSDEMLADPGKFVKQSGNDLVASAVLPKELAVAVGGLSAVGVGLLLPAVQKVREAAARMSSSNNLKQIGLAIHNYESAYGHMPHDILDKNGKPILSWRVAILPFIEQDNVYKQFKLDEPWDSANNKPLSQVMIKTFMSPTEGGWVSKDDAGWGTTNYRAVSGPGGGFESGKKLKFTDFTDGLSNTILVVETAQSVPWAKPGDLPFDEKKPLAKGVAPGSPNIFVDTAGRKTFNVLFADGSVRAVGTGISEKSLKAALTRNGGETFDLDK